MDRVRKYLRLTWVLIGLTLHIALIAAGVMAAFRQRFELALMFFILIELIEINKKLD